MNLKIIPDIVKNQLICALPASDAAFRTAKAMEANHCAAVIITDEDGIVTERDLTWCVVTKDFVLKATLLSDIIPKDPEILSFRDSALGVCKLMRVRGCRHLPVGDQERVVEMVSVRDRYDA
jgi:signal-transduction protein with cAMP-binding, CBS, and nucleotidyltransferase domain